jgi:hypothetical protein
MESRTKIAKDSEEIIALAPPASMTPGRQTLNFKGIYLKGKIMKLEKGNWPAMNAKSIIASVRRVFEKRDISQLTKVAYQFVTLQMGFIAHYNLGGFCGVYEDLAKFAMALQTSEYSNYINYNKEDANRYERDWFVNEYGLAYCKSRTEAMLGIVELAEKWMPVMIAERDAAIVAAEKATLKQLKEKYPND